MTKLPGNERTDFLKCSRVGDAILLTVGFVDAPSAYDDAHIAVYSRRDGKMKTLIQGGHMGRYVLSGHLLYMRSGALLAVPFDPEELEVTGQPSLISESIGREPSSGAGYFAISDSGTLLYRPVESGESDIRIVLADRQGMVTRLSFPGGSFTTPSFSPPTVDRSPTGPESVEGGMFLWATWRAASQPA